MAGGALLPGLQSLLANDSCAAHKEPLEKKITKIRTIFKVTEKDLFHDVGSQLLQRLLESG